MELRLLKAIINPAMIVTWLAGLYLAWAVHWFSAGWWQVKFLKALDARSSDTGTCLLNAAQDHRCARKVQ